MNTNLGLDLWKKVISKEVFLQLQVVRDDLDLDRKSLSQDSRHVDNWFSRIEKNMIDIQLSSFIRILAALDEKSNLGLPEGSKHKDVAIEKIITPQVVWLAFIYNGLKDEKNPDANLINYYIQPTRDDILGKDRLTRLIPTLRAVKKERKKLSDEEADLLDELLILIENKKGAE